MELVTGDFLSPKNKQVITLAILVEEMQMSLKIMEKAGKISQHLS